MPPEQIIHFRDVQPAADQYAAAATLYNLLTGQYIRDLSGGLAARIDQIRSARPGAHLPAPPRSASGILGRRDPPCPGGASLAAATLA